MILQVGWGVGAGKLYTLVGISLGIRLLLLTFQERCFIFVNQNNMAGHLMM